MISIEKTIQEHADDAASLIITEARLVASCLSDRDEMRGTIQQMLISIGVNLYYEEWTNEHIQRLITRHISTAIVLQSILLERKTRIATDET